MEEKDIFDSAAFDPCWKIECGGNCRDCEFRTKRTHHFEEMGLGERIRW